MLGFAKLTFVFSLIGVGLAAIFARTARRPRSTFVRTTLVLLVLSIVPDFVAIPKLSPEFDTATACTLAGLHLVAAAIVIPGPGQSLHCATEARVPRNDETPGPNAGGFASSD